MELCIACSHDVWLKLTPTYCVKISGNRQRIEFVFSGKFFDAAWLEDSLPPKNSSQRNPIEVVMRTFGMYDKFDMRAFLPLLFGQNPIPENHAKLHFTIGIPSGLRSAYYIKIYKPCTYVLIYWYLFHVEPNLSLFHFHLTCKTASISQCSLPGSCVLSDGTYR
jgi:hypothetical protein